MEKKFSHKTILQSIPRVLFQLSIEKKQSFKTMTEEQRTKNENQRTKNKDQRTITKGNRGSTRTHERT